MRGQPGEDGASNVVSLAARATTIAGVSRGELDELVAWAVRVATVLAKLSGQAHRRGDLIECAVRALHGVLKRYDPARGTSVKAFASARVIGEIRDEIALLRARDAHEVALEDVLGDPDDGEDGRGERSGGAAVDAFVLRAAAVDDAADPEMRLLRAEEREGLLRAVHGLPLAERQLLDLRYWHGLEWPRIEEKLGVPKRTLHEQHKKIRGKLRCRTEG